MSLVGRYESLPKRPRSEEARQLLEKIASQVKPIMAKRNWKIGILGEFSPLSPALLGENINHGERINLRLRPPTDVNNFYEFDQLVLVLLHELTHIVHGPHNTSFYKLLSELEEEFYNLKRKGYSGEGFHSDGNRLHGLRVNEYEGRLKGLAAAEKRASRQRLIGKGGVLGGTKSSGKTMREVLAEAAQRRLRDDLTCKTQSQGHATEVEDKVIRDAAETIGIDSVAVQDDKNLPIPPPSSSSQLSNVLSSTTPIPSSSKGSPPPSKDFSKPKPHVTPTMVKSISDDQLHKASVNTNPKPKPTPPNVIEVPDGEWSCPTCTLINPSHSLTCDACTTPKSVETITSNGWFCEFCGAGPREMGFWSCKECGWVRKWG